MSKDEKIFSVRKQLRHMWMQLDNKKPYVPAKDFLIPAFEMSAEKGNSKLNCSIFNWNMILEELAFTMSACCMAYENNAEYISNYDRVIRFMTGALAGHLNVVSKLIISGFDVHARIISRTLSEHIDLMLAISIDPSIADAYFEAADQEDQNRFWHKYVSKGKLRKKIISHLSAENPELADVWEECDNYVKEEEKMIGTAVHPSYLSSAMIVSMGMSHGNGGFGYFGSVDTASNRTLRFVIYKMLELLLVSREQLKDSVARNFADGLPFDVAYLKNRIDFAAAIAAHFVTYHHNIAALNEIPMEI